ncbi:MAG: hypothetical protein RI909_1840 [Bacteroidota bacterium]
MSKPNPNVDFFFTKKSKWQEAYAALRTISLSSGLTEELKWGCPCYTRDDGNVMLIHGFKEYAGLLFMKGALIKDAHGLLVQQSANVQAARQMRFTSAGEITKQKAIIKGYIKQAIDIEKAGLKVVLKKPEEFTMAEEFKIALREMPELKKAFQQLTPGRQRGYLLHFSSAKQAKTREARIEKCVPQILKGKGLDD